MVELKVIEIEVYAPQKVIGVPCRFAAYEPEVSMVNPVVEAYSKIVDGHYVLRTRVRGKETSRLGVLSIDEPEEANCRLLEALLKEIEHLPEFPRGSVKFTSASRKVSDYLTRREELTL